MHIRSLAIARPLVAFVCCCIAFVSYGFETETSLSVSDAEGVDPTIGIEIDYFFTPLSHSSATPWLETVFVERPSQLTLGGQRFESSYLFSPGNFVGAEQIELDRSSQTFDISYFHRNRNSPHSFGGSIRHTSFKFDQPSGFAYRFNPATGAFELIGDPQITEISDSGYRLTGAYDYYLNDQWTIGGRAFFENSPGDTELQGLALQTKRLWRVANRQWISLKGSATLNRADFGGTSRENWLFELSGAYYLDPKTSIEAGIAVPDRLNVKNYTIGFSRFLTEALFIRANLMEVDFDEPNFNGQTLYRLEFGGRF